MPKGAQKVGEVERTEPKPVTEPFNFPEYGVTIHAATLAEAEEELKKRLGSAE